MKLNPLSIPYRVVQNGTTVLGLLVFGAFTGSDSGGLAIGTGVAAALFGMLLALGYQVAYFSRFEYEETPDTFDIESGVFSRRDREIPYGRIQNVDISQNAIQRVLGIAEVRLETAGGTATEARLQYVATDEASRIQEYVSERKRGTSDAEDGVETETETEALFHLSNDELAILGLTSADFRLLGLLSVAASILAPRFVPSDLPPGTSLLLFLGPLTAAGILGVLWVVSGVRAVLRYYDFELTREGRELRYERGLLQRYSGSIPTDKIQTVSVEENVLARRLGYASVTIETAGYGPGSGAEGVQSAVPIAETDRAHRLARAVEPFGDLSFERPPKRARTRYLARYSILLGIGLVGLWALDRFVWSVPRWYLAAGLFALVPVAAHYKWKHLGVHADDDHVITRRGFWIRRTTVVPYYRVQTIVSSQSIFQRRRDLGTVVVDTASSGGLFGRGAVALDVDAGTADRLRGYVFERFQDAIRTVSDRRRGTEPSTAD